MGVLMLLTYNGLGILLTQPLSLQVAHGAMGVGSASLLIYAVSFVPLVDAISVSFAAPFMFMLIAALVLRKT